MTTTSLKLAHFDAGLGGHFDKFKHLVPEFECLSTYEAFLKAVAAHVKLSLQRDSTSHPRYDWWTGSNVKLCFNMDKAKQFDLKGRKALACSLVERTFRLVKLDWELQTPSFLGKRKSSSKLSLSKSLYSEGFTCDTEGKPG